jgi:hypothetical protein
MLRFWDGTGWLGLPVPPPQPQQVQADDRPEYRKFLVGLGGFFAFVLIVSALASRGC